MNEVNKLAGKQVTAVGFDERIDRTKVDAGTGVKGTRRFDMVREEHCSIVLWPGEEVAGHVCPESGAGLVQSVIDFLADRLILQHW